MNFTEFSFWWFLFILGVPLLIFRSIGKRIHLWQDNYDRVALMLFSLSLFWVTAAYSFIIFITEIIFNYVMIRILQRNRGWREQTIATTVIVVDLSILIYYKYLIFFTTSLQKLILLHVADQWYVKILMPEAGNTIPLGISFFTFQMIAFLIYFLKSDESKTVNFIDYINCMSFFPKVVAGPIERWSEFNAQMKNFRFKLNADDIDAGLRWLSLGMFMKFVVADNMASFINLEETKNAWSVLLSVYLFGFKLYFDFAGYSFIAVGIAKVLGINLTINFLAPYMSLNIQEFWHRWHVTLMNWFRDYLYIPLGGSRTKLVSVNIIIVFVLSGLWHGAGWNFVLWGVYHAVLLILFRYVGRHISMPKIVSWFITFNSTMFGWLFFMETDTARLIMKLKTITSPLAYSTSNAIGIFARMTIAEISTLAIVLILANLVFLFEYISAWYDGNFVYNRILSNSIPYALLFLTILLSARSFARFVYFNF